jgi:PIN domain nuclease of toxin-antitoxin system
VRVVADSHAIFWHLQRSPKLSESAAGALRDAGAEEGVVVSVATLIDLWYVTQTTQTVTTTDLEMVRTALTSSTRVDLHVIDAAVTAA